MKTWIVATLVLLALVVLVSPAIVGRLAEQDLLPSLELAGQADGVIVTRQAFERRWFTSQGTHRIEIRNPQARALVAAAAGIPKQAAAPAFIVDTRVDHGLVPFTSMSRDAGSLEPGLARAVSTLRLDTGDGRLIELPARIHTRVGLSGATELELAVEPGTFDAPQLYAKWQAASLVLEQPAAGDPPGADLRLSLAGLGLKTHEGALHLANLTLDSDNAIDGERLDSRLRLAIAGGESSGGQRFELALDLTSALDARALQVLVAALAARAALHEDAALRYPAFDQEFAALVTRGVSLDVEHFELRLPQGVADLRLDMDLPPTAPGSSLFTLMLAMTASADVRVSGTLVESMVAGNPQAAMVVALGYLKQDGDDYFMEIDYARGVLEVNGAPVQLPTTSGRGRSNR